MKTERTMVAALVLNLAFCVFEYVGGMLTGSTAIASDAVHDLGDAVALGVACLAEKISKRQGDDRYTFGYARYGVIGAVVSGAVLAAGSCFMILKAVQKWINPTPIQYDGMIVLAVIGMIVNAAAVLLTHGGQSLNRKAMMWHLLEDVLGWAAVLIGAIVMRWTDCAWLDPLLTVGVSVFVLFHAVRNLKEAMLPLLEKAPSGSDATVVEEYVRAVGGVADVHHIHCWSIDGRRHCATMHVMTDGDADNIKKEICQRLQTLGICHATIETETAGERCRERACALCAATENSTHHGHGHGKKN